ncbi:hypothetical protein [Fimbriiglobus ruber]|uniref:Uncharacterized protein n=1 Tax=Fimbriiglobus ruber TaxID=1908690 RepID=A0A225DN42_9BACT|nr:hypothetical protein [Fimbriiglobus ruber]OWK42493.1 hypothetical protein FRUB_04571 [Fimbriiglobus ruber]
MAEVFLHPDWDRDFPKSVFTLPDGEIEIRSHDGTPLTVAENVYLLELAKQILLNEALED